MSASSLKGGGGDTTRTFTAVTLSATRDWRKLYKEELHYLYSPNIIRQIKSRRVRWTGHVAPMEEAMNAYRILMGKPERKIH
jgi:hypothetical protein